MNEIKMLFSCFNSDLKNNLANTNSAELIFFTALAFIHLFFSQSSIFLRYIAIVRCTNHFFFYRL